MGGGRGYDFRQERHKCNKYSVIAERGHIEVAIVSAFTDDGIDGYDLLFDSIAIEVPARSLDSIGDVGLRLVCSSPKDYSVS